MGKNKDGKVKEMHVCGCHLSDNDVVKGVRQGTLTLAESARLRTPQELRNNATEQKRAHPSERGSGFTPAAKRFKQAAEEDSQKNKQLQQNLKESQTQLSKAESKISQLFNDNHLLSEQSIEKTEKIKQLEQELAFARATINNQAMVVTHTHHALQNETALKERLLTERDHTVDELEEQLAKKKEQLASKEEQLASKEEQLASKEEQIESLHHHYTDILTFLEPKKLRLLK
jgi:DNA repair exonuclease SbcCD ATPase subunit